MTVDRAHRPAAGPPATLDLPDFRVHRLANGLTIHHARRAGVPELSARLVVEAGTVTEDAGSGGATSLVSRLLTEGAGERDAGAMARWMDRIGIGFEAAAGYDVANASIHALSETLDSAFEFLGAVLREPRFEPTEFERVRDQRLDEIARELDEPAVVADRVLLRELYGAHPYGRPTGGRAESVGALTRDDIVARHADRYVPSTAHLFVAGEPELDRILTAADRHLGSWSGNAAGSVATSPPRREPGQRWILVDRPGSAQAEIRVATIGVPHGTADHHAIVVANAILGGLFNSRINMNLREDKGWTYGARTTFHFRRQPGPFIARTAVDADVTGPALLEILSEIEGMRTAPPGQAELDLARNALTRSLPLQFETAAQMVARVSRLTVYGLPDDYWEAYRERIEAVTADDVQRVCGTYLPDSSLIGVIVTDVDRAASRLPSDRSFDRRELAAALDFR